jgi:hypothetical protein
VATEDDHRGDTGGKRRLSYGVNNGKRRENVRGEGEVDVVLLDEVPSGLLSESLGCACDGGRGRVSRWRKEIETERTRTVDVLSALDRHGSSFLVLQESGGSVDVDIWRAKDAYGSTVPGILVDLVGRASSEEVFEADEGGGAICKRAGQRKDRGEWQEHGAYEVV